MIKGYSVPRDFSWIENYKLYSTARIFSIIIVSSDINLPPVCFNFSKPMKTFKKRFYSLLGDTTCLKLYCYIFEGFLKSRKLGKFAKKLGKEDFPFFHKKWASGGLPPTRGFYSQVMWECGRVVWDCGVINVISVILGS